MRWCEPRQYKWSVLRYKWGMSSSSKQVETDTCSSKQVETDTCTKNYPLSWIVAMHTKKWKPDLLLEDGERVTDGVAHNHQLQDSCLGAKPWLNWSSSCYYWPGHYQGQQEAPLKVSLQFREIRSSVGSPINLSRSLRQGLETDHAGRLCDGLHESKICEDTESSSRPSYIDVSTFHVVRWSHSHSTTFDMPIRVL